MASRLTNAGAAASAKGPAGFAEHGGVDHENLWHERSHNLSNLARLETTRKALHTRTLQIQGSLFEVMDLVVDLDAAAGRLQHENPVLGIDIHGHRPVKPPLRLQIYPAARLDGV